MWRHIATRRRRLGLAEVVVVVLHRVHVVLVLVVLILEVLSGVLLVLRHRRCSCCLVA
jgi:tryptophan-rich sensory protein